MVGHCKDVLRLGTAGTFVHCRNNWWSGTAGTLGGWALQGCLVVGHCRDAGWLATAET